MLEAGVTTFGRRRICALRMRVSISPKGSLMDILLAPLPTRLGHAGDQTLARQIAELVAAHSDLAVVAARAARQLATIANANGRRVARHLRQLDARRKALFRRDLQVVGDCLQTLALLSGLRDEAPAPVVLLDRTCLSHLNPPKA